MYSTSPQAWDAAKDTDVDISVTDDSGAICL